MSDASPADCACLHSWLTVDVADGHYLNLPVVESDGRLVGIVDVLKLTYATLEQVRFRSLSIGHKVNTADAAFCLSTLDRIHVGRQDQH